MMAYSQTLLAGQKQRMEIMPENVMYSRISEHSGWYDCRSLLLLLYVDLLERLRLTACPGLDGGGLDDDRLVCSSDHLTPDKRELLLVEKYWYLLYLSVRSDDLLDDLYPARRRLGRLVHLLWLELNDLRR